MTTISQADDQRRAHFEALVNFYPRLTFHYGLGFEELVRMPQWAVQMYVDDLPEILSGEQMRAIQSASFPHQKRSVQKSIIRRLEKSRPRSQPVARSESIEDFQGALAGMGFGVEIQEKTEEVVTGA